LGGAGFAHERGESLEQRSRPVEPNRVASRLLEHLILEHRKCRHGYLHPPSHGGPLPPAEPPQPAAPAAARTGQRATPSGVTHGFPPPGASSTVRRRRSSGFLQASDA